MQEAFGIQNGTDAKAEMDDFFEKEKHALVIEHFLMANGLPALVFLYQLPDPLPTNDPQGRVVLDQELSAFLEMLKFEEDKLQATRRCFLDAAVLSLAQARELDSHCTQPTAAATLTSPSFASGSRRRRRQRAHPLASPLE